MIDTFLYIILTNKKQMIGIYINVQFYLYSSQDLMIKSDGFKSVKAGNIYCLNLLESENAFVYSNCANGVILLNRQILQDGQHNNINFYPIDDNNTLCEVKPFGVNENILNYDVDGANVKLITNGNQTYIYFNSVYYGIIKDMCKDVTFTKFGKNNQFGIIAFGGRGRFIILFNSAQILYCGNYIDFETNAEYVQIYSHSPNIFNVGQLFKYSFNNDKIEIKTVKDRGVDYNQANSQFDLIYFIEAIKCGRFKYAYNKLSYDLKSVINIDTLKDYFGTFDKYIYLSNAKAYVTFKNGKIERVHRFEIKDNLIDNIY